MPYSPGKLVRPELALQYRGVRIYHTYRNDEMDSGRMAYWFTTNPNEDEPLQRFDVRELKSWETVPSLSSVGTPWSSDDEDAHILQVLRRVIDSGELPVPEIP